MTSSRTPPMTPSVTLTEGVVLGGETGVGEQAVSRR
jgi:hypothetical protein